MGADFIEKATPTFKKSWDRARIALATADLFTRAPSGAARLAAAEIIGNATLRVGDHLTVEAQDGGSLPYGATPRSRASQSPRRIW
jgi:hypothetical protein